MKSKVLFSDDQTLATTNLNDIVVLSYLATNDDTKDEAKLVNLYTQYTSLIETSDRDALTEATRILWYHF